MAGPALLDEIVSKNVLFTKVIVGLVFHACGQTKWHRMKPAQNGPPPALAPQFSLLRIIAAFFSDQRQSHTTHTPYTHKQAHICKYTTRLRLTQDRPSTWLGSSSHSYVLPSPSNISISIITSPASAAPQHCIHSWGWHQQLAEREAPHTCPLHPPGEQLAGAAAAREEAVPLPSVALVVAGG